MLPTLEEEEGVGSGGKVVDGGGSVGGEGQVTPTPSERCLTTEVNDKVTRRR